jgi:hypothetical protein
VRIAILAATCLIGVATNAYCAKYVTKAYTLDPAGDGIQLAQQDGGAGGFTFSARCTNQMIVGGFEVAAKLGKDTWAITVPSQSTTAVETLLLNEQKLTWQLWYGDSSVDQPYSEINAGTLTAATAC